MRARARAVVVGGGVGGFAVLYSLTRLGWNDVVLVERADLTSGSTFHSAGLVGQLRSSLSLTKMMMSSVELYRSLESEVGLETGWREVGSLRLASSKERMEEIARQAGWAQTFALPLGLISPGEAQNLFSPLTTDGVLGAAFIPTDGYVDPSQLTLALAEGARRRGAEVNTSTRVTGIRVDRGAVTAVETDRGEIETEIVVNAGGMYAREIGALARVNVPIVPMAHEYLITKPSGLPLDMPTMRDPSLLVYFRFADALTMADNHVVYKNGAKEIAHANGCAITFMAKPFETWIGNSCHIHASLFRDGGPAFAHDETLFERFLAGQIACFEELAIFLAPTINSYKRYAAGSWAPTSLAWGHDNRTCGFRIVGQGGSKRVETRIPGGDVNPYLAFAAIIAAGLHGIDAGLERPPALEGNAYESDAKRFPSTMREAIAALESGTMARAAFGDQVVDHYLNYARTEQRFFDKTVTDWERMRYFERG